LAAGIAAQAKDGRQRNALLSAAWHDAEHRSAKREQGAHVRTHPRMDEFAPARLARGAQGS
jgi:hypothetical protein